MNKPISAIQTFGLALAAIFLLPMVAFAAPLSHEIKIDHFGYRPADTKISIFSANPGSEVEIRNATDEVVFCSFYLQRCNTPKLAIHAGDYADPVVCHLQDLSTARRSDTFCCGSGTLCNSYQTKFTFSRH